MRAMSDPSEALPELRASDADREQTVELLQHGASNGQLTVDELEERIHSAFAARTRAELQRLTADLSVERARSGAPTPGSDSGLSVREGAGGTGWIVSIMGGHDKKGRWRVGHHCKVISIMGGSDLDLNDAELSGPLTQITMFSLMGGGDIRVPNGVDVQVSDFALMGGNDVKLGDEVPPPGSPSIHIRLVSIMGGAGVRRGRKLTKAQRRQERELRRAKRDLEQ
jgi:hypothetical protein